MAYVRRSDDINKMADLRGKRAYFPRFDGISFHSVINYIRRNENLNCYEALNYFGEVCAGGVNNFNVSSKFVCDVGSGEIDGLKALVEGKVDVAFVSLKTFNMYLSEYNIVINVIIIIFYTTGVANKCTVHPMASGYSWLWMLATQFI